MVKVSFTYSKRHVFHLKIMRFFTQNHAFFGLFAYKINAHCTKITRKPLTDITLQMHTFFGVFTSTRF